MTVMVAEVVTTDPERGGAALGELYGRGRPLRLSGDTTDFACALLFATAGDVASERMRFTARAGIEAPPAETFMAISLTHGVYHDLAVGPDHHRLAPGDVLFMGRDAGLTASFHDVDVLSLRVPFDVLDRVAYERAGTDGPVRFTGTRPVSEAARYGWRRLQGHVLREMTAQDSTLESELIQAQLAELIAATALVTFPNAALSGPPIARRARMAPASVRRALVHIEEHAAEPLTASAIAAAVAVTPRALQYGFQRHLGLSPMTYLRRVRLERAHDELRAADPTDGTTVAAIARRWGFAKPARFTEYYRAEYGVAPAQTLDRDGA
jgi:AraC-like DNA-binding protein